MHSSRVGSEGGSKVPKPQSSCGGLSLSLSLFLSLSFSLSLSMLNPETCSGGLCEGLGRVPPCCSSVAALLQHCCSSVAVDTVEDSGEFSVDKRWHTQQSSEVCSKGGSKIPKPQSADVKVPGVRNSIKCRLSTNTSDLSVMGQWKSLEK